MADLSISIQSYEDGAGATGSVELFARPPTVLDLTDFKRDLSELTDRLGHAQDCL
jgi:hypothetical protein